MGKTGGGTINKWLYSIIPHHFSFQGQFDGTERLTGMASINEATQKLNALRPRRKKALKLVTGHLPLPLLTQLPQPAQCITVIREPIDRELSSFYYLKTIGGDREEYFKNLTIAQYATDISAADNYQVRILSGLEELNPVWKKNITYPSIQGRTDLLELAKENLKKYFVAVGSLEKLDEFALTLSKLMQNKAPIDLGKENVTHTRTSHQAISEHELAILKIKIDLDMALYEWINTVEAQAFFKTNLSQQTYPSFFRRLIEKINFKITWWCEYIFG